MANPLLVDVTAAPHSCCDHGLEALHKAIAEEPSEAAIWRPHDNPLLTDLVERWTAIGSAALQAVQDTLLGGLGVGEPVPILRKADFPDPGDLDALRERLAKPMSEYTPDDWVAFVDLIFGTRMPDASLDAVAADMTAKATLAGHLQAIAEGGPGAPSVAVLAHVMGRVAAGVAGAPGAAAFESKQAAVREAQAAAMDFAKTRIGLNMRGLTNAARTRVSRTILSHVQEHGLSRPGKLQQTLLDDFGTLNRDWRRIAVTEAGEVANTAYLGQFPDGSRVQRLEAYEGACPFCRKIDGMVFEWSTKRRPERDGWTHVWPGKTNVGRSASPRKRTDEGLVEREPEELWWPAAGVQHPNCRGRWLSLPSETLPPGVNPQFAEWLAKELKK
jgi:hypothetical protein